MAEQNKSPVVLLVELLESQARVEWETVEELVGDVPGWLRVVRMMRDPGRNVRGGYTGRAASPESGLAVSREMRRRLHELFLPYAILLDARSTPTERAFRLKDEAGKIPIRFAEECLEAHIPAVVEAAQAVLDAAQSEETLLRGAMAPHIAPEELLRSVGADSHPDTTSSAALLHPVDAMPSERATTHTWLHRLISGRKSRP